MRVNVTLTLTKVDISGRLVMVLSEEQRFGGSCMSGPQEVILASSPPARPATAGPAPPAIVVAAGPAGYVAWEEFFAAHLRNPHTRVSYLRAARQFFNWLGPRAASLHEITPGMVGAYFNQHSGSIPSRKVYLAALRSLFDLFVTRHLMVINPAASVRGERYQVIEGKTPEILAGQVRALFASIQTTRRRRQQTLPGFLHQESTVPYAVGLRDRAIIGVCVYTAARAGAIAKLRLKHFAHDGTQWTLRFEEKGGKSREIPLRHDLSMFILEYLHAAGIKDAPGDSPLFRSAHRTSGTVTDRPVTGVDLCRMVKRRLKDAGLPRHLSPHSFRVAVMTDLLDQGVPLEDVQFLAGHADPKTTRLYDRRQKRVTRNVVERISI
jgi:integrase/recombinase XerD